MKFMSMPPLKTPEAAHRGICCAFPEPQAHKTSILPVFIPFQGCPGKCVFCAQNAITGTGNPSLTTSFTLFAHHLNALDRPMGVGFFGGTFTALPKEWWKKFLGLAGQYKAKGLLTHIRCSTRPDCISPDMLQTMQDMGLDMIELGVQTFDPGILSLCRRGHDEKCVLKACDLIRKAGMELGLQMLPGLPGQKPEDFFQDIAQCCAIRPETLRLYPCLVLEGTVLARWWRGEKYKPWNIRTTTDVLGQALLRLWNAGIRVIRMGLPPEPLALQNILAGPWHPALGNMIRSQALMIWLEKQWRLTGPWSNMIVPRRLSGDLWGHGRCNAQRLAEMNLHPGNISFHQRPDFFFIPAAV